MRTIHTNFEPAGAGLPPVEQAHADTPEDLDLSDEGYNDSPLPSLEDLLEESVEEANDEGDAVAEEQAAAPDALPDLDDLLSQSVAARKESIEAKAARERLRRGGLSARERAEDQARLAAWEAAHEWSAAANVALFGVQVCACGEEHSLFLGLMERQTHRHLKGTQRWVKAETSKAALPNEVCYRKAEVAMCAACCTDKGWPWEQATVWKEDGRA